MLLSILIPTYNGGDNLIRAVDSVYKNIHLNEKDYEIIVCDDKFEDDSIKRLKAKFKDKKNLRIYINDKNL